MAARAAHVAAPPRASSDSRARVGAVHPTSSPSSTISPTSPLQNRRQTAPTHPRRRRPFPPSNPSPTGLPVDSRGYKNDPRAPLLRFPLFPKLPHARNHSATTNLPPPPPVAISGRPPPPP
ncbi:hypothetical protein DAI22_01g337933 [Oryza sativa Japonica Group]|nr:hypothetical protein DAI22_01g337933 [Oryza sativa Japonica Group]